MLVHIKEIIKKAQRGRYAIGAFNTCNLEITLGIVRAAVARRSPVIIQVTESTIQYAGLKPITHIVKTIAKNETVDIPVALHLDHGSGFASVSECINAGFSSIHIDASQLPFDENVAITRQSVAYAHRFGVWAQGELGSILGKEGLRGVKIPQDKNAFLTDPKKIPEFIRSTHVDTLAVSVGTLHGLFKGKEKVDLKRLSAIHKQTRIPLVLHGASGIKDREIVAALKKGIKIINIDTELRIAFTETLRKTLKQDISYYDPRKILGPSIDAIQKVVERKMEVFGCSGKA